MASSFDSKHKIIPTILCGGSGSRLWPVSRESHPKPFIRLDDGDSLLQKAFLRGLGLPNVSDIITVTNRELFFKIEDEYNAISLRHKKAFNHHFILEPFGRNTALAIAAASLQADSYHAKDAIILVMPADQIINDQKTFAASVMEACELAQMGKLVTFGVQPTEPETGYGYIEYSGHEVIRFIEKPSLEVAQQCIDTNNFLWNSGIFCFKASVMLAEMEQHCPDILEQTRKCLEFAKASIGKNLSLLEIDPEHFYAVENESIDYAVMEKSDNAAVVACDIGWCDIGCWRALGDLISPDENNNRVQGDAVLHDSHDCTIKSEERVVGTVGVSNIVIIDTVDALLVADKDRVQEVKYIYEQLKVRKHAAYKMHRTVYRPWGNYTVLEEGEYFKVKRIEIKLGASISLQLHKHRSEHWVVVKGKAKVFNNGKELTLKANESTYISVKHKHRLENIGKEVLVIIELQTGDYLGEDDIVRFDDMYGRKTVAAAK